MFSSSGTRIVHTVRFRLAFWYAGLFAVFALLLFLIENSLLRSQLGSRLDDDLLAGTREFEALYAEFGLQALGDEFSREGESNGSEDVLLIFRSPNLKVLASSDLTPWGGLALDDPGLAELGAGEVRFRTLRSPTFDRGVRIAEARTQDGNVLQVGRSLAEDQLLMRAYRSVFAAVVLGMLAFGVALGWFLIGRVMSGLEQVAQTASRIGHADLAERVPSGTRGTEIEELVTAFNDMLDRIDRLVFELKEVTDNIAHDLRGPLTRIRGVAESTLTGAREPGEVGELAAVVIEESDRLVQLIDTMLEISETNAGVAEIRMEPVDVTRLVGEAHELFLPVADDKALALRLNVPETSLLISGDLTKLQRVVANLVDNAIKYTPTGGRVDISVSADGTDVVITVADTGIGIDGADQPRVFDRFFRADASRSTPGNGLGLSLAQAIARAHGGDIDLESQLGQGSCFRIRLPQTPHDT